ncbi:hypothetical protein [Vibrio rarus]|uniref:hypothetical protein n=1 Tax=Vibrio rarus TaxID=413403 RepID=UPI0021C3B214|nr:hypothetical protein [Vibrio rarus]
MNRHRSPRALTVRHDGWVKTRVTRLHDEFDSLFTNLEVANMHKNRATIAHKDCRLAKPMLKVSSTSP